MLAPGERPPPLRASVRGLVRDLRALGIASVRLAQAEMGSAARRLGPALAILAGALALATASFIALVAVIVLALAPLLGLLGAALVVAAGAALLAALLARLAIRRLTGISFAPRRTGRLLMGRDIDETGDVGDGSDRQA